MEEGAKRRLVGAAVMVVLLVVFLPMLMEEETRSPVSEQEMSIPPRPDFDRGFDASVADAPIDPSAPAYPDYREPVPEDPRSTRELAPPALFDAPATMEPEITTESEREFAPERAPVLIEEAPREAKPAPPPKPNRDPESSANRQPAPAPASSDLSSWVIQVASLREHKRAYSLVQDLRAKGFPAYIEEAEVREQLWHRVRVGPEIDRKRIEIMASSLKAQTGLNVQIQRYP